MLFKNFYGNVNPSASDSKVYKKRKCSKFANSSTHLSMLLSLMNWQHATHTHFEVYEKATSSVKVNLTYYHNERSVSKKDSY